MGNIGQFVEYWAMEKVVFEEGEELTNALQFPPTAKILRIRQ